jgi:hypothetical protein
MTWHNVTVAEDGRDQLLRKIRRAGGSIMHSPSCAAGYTVIDTTLED